MLIGASEQSTPGASPGGGPPEEGRAPGRHRKLRRSGWQATPATLVSALATTFRAAPVLVSASLVLQVVAASSAGVLLLLLDQILGRVVVPTAPEALVQQLVPAFVVLGVVLAVALSAQFLQNGLRVLVTERVTWRTSQQVLDVAAAADQSLFDTSSFHDRLTRANAATVRPAMMTDGLFTVVGGLSSTLSLAAVVAVHEPGLLLVLLISATPLFAANSSAARRLHGTMTDLTENDRRRGYLRSLMTQRVTSMEVRSYGLASFLRARERSLFDVRLRRLTRTILPATVLTGLSGMLAGAGLLASLIVIVAQTVAGTMQPASASLVGVGLLQLTTAVASLLAGVSRLYENSLFLDDLGTFRDQLNGMGPQPTTSVPAAITDVRVENVTFRYPGATAPVLRDVSLSLRRGEVVALVGGNGSGKTTLAKLLGNLYCPESGRILWDGVDVAAMDPEAARSSIAVLHQDFVAFLMTAGENIGLGKVDHLSDRGAIRAAAHRAGSADFVDRLPDRYATGLGTIFEGSVDLSGGQWQRLALARALFRDAPILILDEPTAALDASAEQDFFHKLRELAADRIVVLISHRMTGVRSADRIYVLDAGRIVEEGTHDGLMARGGRYAHLQQAHSSTSAGDGSADGGPAVVRSVA